MSSDHHTHHHGHHHDDKLGDHPEADLHGMLVIGERTVYLSHLPMFGHAHHDVQAILHVRLTGDGDPQATYAEDRRASGERMYTLEPEHFFLPLLVTAEPGQECLCEFSANLYRGHFERGGTPVLRDVTVFVEDVVHFRQFDPGADKPVIQKYVLFGRGDERFLAHLITAPPDFDQVLSVRVASGDVSDDDLSEGPTLFFPRRANDIANRLRPGERVFAEVQKGTGQVELEIGEELYFEEGELGESFSQQQTEAEKLAGF